MLPVSKPFPRVPISVETSHFLTWGHLGRPFEGHLNALGCEAWQASGEMPLSNGPFFGDSGWGHLWTNPPKILIYFDMEVENDESFQDRYWIIWKIFSFQVKQQRIPSFKVFRSSSKSSFGHCESWALAWPSSLNLCCFFLWSDSCRDTNSTISIFRLEALAYIDHGSSLNHLSGMPLCLMPQADPWRSLDRAGDKKRSVAHEMEHHIRLLVGHIVGIGQPGNEITTSGQNVF